MIAIKLAQTSPLMAIDWVSKFPDRAHLFSSSKILSGAPYSILWASLSFLLDSLLKIFRLFSWGFMPFSHASSFSAPSPWQLCSFSIKALILSWVMMKPWCSKIQCALFGKNLEKLEMLIKPSQFEGSQTTILFSLLKISKFFLPRPYLLYICKGVYLGWKGWNATVEGGLLVPWDFPLHLSYQLCEFKMYWVSGNEVLAPK